MVYVKLLKPYISFPRRRSPITESTREVLFLFDWCFCAWLPPSLYLRDPRASLGDCEDRSRSRPLRTKWSGASPRPPSGGSPLAGTTPPTSLLWGYACYYCCMPSSPVLLHIYCTCFPTFWYCHPYILQHLMEMFLLPLDIGLVMQHL